MIIKSSKSLCENYEAISSLAHSSGEPIYITKMGEGDLVILTMDAYEKSRSSFINKTSEQSVDYLEAPQITPSLFERSIGMTEFELGNELKAMYEGAPRGDQVALIHLFGIRFADALLNERLSKREILKVSGLPESYQTEISKGVRLAKYVKIKDEFTV